MNVLDMDNVIKGLEECVGNGNCTKCQYGKEKQALSCKKLLADALDLLKHQEVILEFACKVIGYSGICNTELCTEHCDTNGKYKCVECWLEKEVSKGR